MLLNKKLLSFLLFLICVVPLNAGYRDVLHRITPKMPSLSLPKMPQLIPTAVKTKSAAVYNFLKNNTLKGAQAYAGLYKRNPRATLLGTVIALGTTGYGIYKGYVALQTHQALNRVPPIDLNNFIEACTVPFSKNADLIISQQILETARYNDYYVLKWMLELITKNQAHLNGTGYFVNYRNEKNETAISLAQAMGYTDIVTLLQTYIEEHVKRTNKLNNFYQDPELNKHIQEEQKKNLLKSQENGTWLEKIKSNTCTLEELVDRCVQCIKNNDYVSLQTVIALVKQANTIAINELLNTHHKTTGWTPLCSAVYYYRGNTAIIELLLQSGAEITVPCGKKEYDSNVEKDVLQKTAHRSGLRAYTIQLPKTPPNKDTTHREQEEYKQLMKYKGDDIKEKALFKTIVEPLDTNISHKRLLELYSQNSLQGFAVLQLAAKNPYNDQKLRDILCKYGVDTVNNPEELRALFTYYNKNLLFRCNRAIRSGNLSTLKNIIEPVQKLGAEIYKKLLMTPNACGETLLHVAVRSQNEDILRYLMSEGAAIDCKNYLNQTPLDLADSLQCNQTILNILMTNENQEAFNMWVSAIVAKDFSAINALIKKNIHNLKHFINLTEQSLHSSLLLKILENNNGQNYWIDKINLLIEHGADLYKLNKNCLTPATFNYPNKRKNNCPIASMVNTIQKFKAACENNEDVNFWNEITRQTVYNGCLLQCAVHNNREDLVKKILEHLVYETNDITMLHHRNSIGQTALDCAQDGTKLQSLLALPPALRYTYQSIEEWLAEWINAAATGDTTTFAKLLKKAGPNASYYIQHTNCEGETIFNAAFKSKSYAILNLIHYYFPDLVPSPTDYQSLIKERYKNVMDNLVKSKQLFHMLSLSQTLDGYVKSVALSQNQ